MWIGTHTGLGALAGMVGRKGPLDGEEAGLRLHGMGGLVAGSEALSSSREIDKNGSEKI